MLGEPTPHEADPVGASYAFEKRVSKAAGGDGFADVWKRDFFAWEYKGRNKDLRAAYVQLMGYKDDLGWAEPGLRPSAAGIRGPAVLAGTCRRSAPTNAAAIAAAMGIPVAASMYRNCPDG